MTAKNMTSEAELQKQYEYWKDRASKRQSTLDKVNRAIEQLAIALADCSEDERADLLLERRDLVAERDAMQDELRVLEHRRDAANLAIYELRLSLAEAEARRMDELIRSHRERLNDALNERRHFLNGGRARMPTSEGDERSIELEKRIAEMTAESQILGRDASRVGWIRERAAIELANVRRELEIPEGKSMPQGTSVFSAGFGPAPDGIVREEATANGHK